LYVVHSTSPNWFHTTTSCTRFVLLDLLTSAFLMLPMVLWTRGFGYCKCGDRQKRSSSYNCQVRVGKRECHCLLSDVEVLMVPHTLQCLHLSLSLYLSLRCWCSHMAHHTDAPDPRESFVFHLAEEGGLELFEHILLVSAHQDRWCPFYR
jgi:hypothetical protein